MLKIVLFAHTFLPNLGGRELVVYYLGRALKDLGHDVNVFGPSGWRSARHLDFGFPVYRYPSLLRMPVGTPGLRGRLRQVEYAMQFTFHRLLTRPDIVHAHTTYPAGYTAALTRSERSKWGLVVTPHGVDIQTIPELNHGMLLRSELQPKIHRSLQQADALTSISASIRDSLIVAGANPEKIWNIPNGVDCRRFENTSKTTDTKLEAPPSQAPVIVTVGNYHPRKGQEVLIRAMPKVIATLPSAKLVIVGRGTERLTETARTHGVEENVVIMGGIEFPLAGTSDTPTDALADLYRSSSVYVSAGNNEQAEGLSLAVLEAMAAGLPIVATDISGNRDIVSSGQNGQLVSIGSPDALADGILSVLTNETARTRMAINARALALNYSWENIASQYVEVYEHILSRRAT